MRYIVLGGGIRMFTPNRPLAAEAKRSGLEAPRPVPVTMMAVSDEEGNIAWFRSDEILVVEVDGSTPGALLAPRGAYR